MRHGVARGGGDVRVKVGTGVCPIRGGRLEDTGCWGTGTESGEREKIEGTVGGVKRIRYVRSLVKKERCNESRCAQIEIA